MVECQFIFDTDGLPICAVCQRKLNVTGFSLDKIHRICRLPKPKPEPSHIKAPENLPNPPNYPRRLYNFTAASISHFVKGNPTCTQEDIDARLEICKSCELFKPSKVNDDTGICTHETCGCNLSSDVKYLNKLAWADQECPIGFWKKIEKKDGE